MKEEKYKVAIDTHKFYDTISMSIVGGMITVTGASFLLYDKIQNNQFAYLLFIITIIVIFGLLVIYRKSAYYANVARNVSADLEINENLNIGISDVLKNLNKNEYQKYKAVKSMFKGIYGAIHLIFVSLSISLLLLPY